MIEARRAGPSGPANTPASSCLMTALACAVKMSPGFAPRRASWSRRARARWCVSICSGVASFGSRKSVSSSFLWRATYSATLTWTSAIARALALTGWSARPACAAAPAKAVSHSAAAADRTLGPRRSDRFMCPPRIARRAGRRYKEVNTKPATPPEAERGAWAPLGPSREDPYFRRVSVPESNTSPTRDTALNVSSSPSISATRNEYSWSFPLAVIPELVSMFPLRSFPPAPTTK
jgi:hypothetical protein